MRELSVMGLAEVLPHLPRLIKRLNQTTEAALALKPDAVVTVDSPGFCLSARPSSPRFRHPGRPLRRAAAVGLASGPRAQACHSASIS